jgi:hypothetical protein
MYGFTHFSPYLVHIEISKTAYNSECIEYLTSIFPAAINISIYLYTQLIHSIDISQQNKPP